MTRALIPFLLLIAVSLPASEIALAPVLAAPTTTSFFPRVASNGDGFLAVWEDMRANGEIRAARLDASGNLLDTFGFRIADGQGIASVASAGGDYMVAIARACGPLEVVRVTRDGQVSAPKAIDSATFRPCLNDIAIASNGSSYLVAADVGALLDLDGNVINGPFPLRFAQVDVASNGRGYMIAGSSPVQALPVSDRGELGIARTIGDGRSAAVASDGQQYLIVTTGNAVVTQVVASDATPLGPPKFVTTPIQSWAARAVWSGSDYVIAYSQVTPGSANGMYIAHANAGGDFASSSVLATDVLDPTLVSSFDLAPARGGAMLVADTLGQSVVAGFVSSSVGPLLPISFAGAAQYRPELAPTADGAVAVWREYLSTTGFRVHGVSLDANGRPRSPVADVGETDNFFDTIPRAAFDGTNVIVTWTSGSVLFARRFTTLMQPIDAPFVIGRTFGQYGLTAANGTTLVAYVPGGSGASPDVHAALLRTDGPAISKSDIVVGANFDFGFHVPAAAWNGSEFLVAWAHSLAPPPTQGLFPNPPEEILAARVTATGVVIDTSPIRVAMLPLSLTTLTLASNGSDFYAAWLQSGTVSGKAIRANGTVAATADVLSAPDAAIGPALARYGESYAAAWIVRDGTYTRSIEIRAVGGALSALPQIVTTSVSEGVSLTALGSAIGAGYARVSDDAGGVMRAFVNTTPAPRPRRRPTS